MPASQSIVKKKYAVVTFTDEDSCEVIPTIWMLNNEETKWPNSRSSSVIQKHIRECTHPSSDWITVKIKAKSFTDTFSKATRKAQEALETSHVSSDSEDDVPGTVQQRKRKVPLRYLQSSPPLIAKLPRIAANETAETSDTDSESIIGNKIFQIPQLPDIGTCGQISNSRGHSSKVQHVIQNDDSVPPALYSRGHSSKVQHVIQNDDPVPTALYSRMFQMLEKLYKRMSSIEEKVDGIGSKVDKLTNSSATPIDYLPDDLNLPVTSVEELTQLNDRLKRDKDFATILVRFLFNAGSGKSPRSFVLSVTKRLLAQQVALQFSRFGRKGKKSFINFNETLNVILAATNLKFKDAGREDLAEMFGRCLACSSDWNKRKPRPSDYEDCSLTFTETE